MRLFIIIIAMIFAIGGCKEEFPEAKDIKKQKGAVKTQPIPQQELPKTKVYGYVYDPEGKRDPFAPLIAITKEKAKKSEVIGTLEGYDIGDFKLIATAKKAGQYYGLLLTPDSKAYTVREGATIGLQKGTIKKITNNRVIIIEHSKDYEGKLKQREIVLELLKGEGE
ncbi:MAG: pilus assembly protein PilP [Nitrospirae bacterium]|nr:pilus assembly protein PilP [Nitrospirota bacterium]